MRLTLADLYASLSKGNITKTAQAFESIIRKRIREDGKARIALPPIKINPSDLTYDPNNETLFRVIHIEPEVHRDFAVVTSLKGKAEKVQTRPEAVAAYLYTVATKEVEIDVVDTWKTNYSLQSWLQQNLIKDLEKKETQKFLDLVHVAANSTGSIIQIPAASWISFDQILSQGISKFSEDERRGYLNLIMMNEKDFTIMVSNLFSQQVAVDQLAREIISDSLQITTLFGYQFVVTRQSSLIPPGVIYLFAKPEWLGEFALVTDVSVHIESKQKKFSFAAWEAFTMAIANPYGCVVLVQEGIPATNLGNWDKYTESGIVA